MCLALERLASRTCGSNESNRAPARGRDTFAVCLTTSSLNDRVDSYNGYAVQSDLAQFEFIAAGKSSCCSHVPFLLLFLLLLLLFFFFFFHDALCSVERKAASPCRIIKDISWPTESTRLSLSLSVSFFSSPLLFYQKKNELKGIFEIF